MPKKKSRKRVVTRKKKSVKSQKIQEIKVDLSTVKYCPECGSDNVFYSKMRDELICRDCGAITSKLTPEQMKKSKEVSGLI